MQPFILTSTQIGSYDKTGPGNSQIQYSGIDTNALNPGGVGAGPHGVRLVNIEYLFAQICVRNPLKKP